MRFEVKVARCLVVLGVAACAAAGAQVEQSSPAAAKKPVLWVEQAIADVGVVDAGETVEVSFVLHNDSDVPVKILKAKPS